MFLKNSRYQDALSFDANSDGSQPFKGVRERVIGTATAAIEHGLQESERFDAMGMNYYNDSRRWWRILDANPDVLCAAALEINVVPTSDRGPDAEHIGEVILIPKTKE